MHLTQVPPIISIVVIAPRQLPGAKHLRVSA
jgi:hypothetical protein